MYAIRVGTFNRYIPPACTVLLASHPETIPKEAGAVVPMDSKTLFKFRLGATEQGRPPSQPLESRAWKRLRRRMLMSPRRVVALGKSLVRNTKCFSGATAVRVAVAGMTDIAGLGVGLSWCNGCLPLRCYLMTLVFGLSVPTNVSGELVGTR